MANKNASVVVPFGRKGLDKNDNYLSIDPLALVEADNVIFTTDVLERSLGMSEFDSTGVGASGVCLGGFDWRPSSGLQYQVTAWDDGSLYRSSGTNLDATTLASSQGYTEPVYYVQGGKIDAGDDRVLYIYSKDVRPQQVTGSGTTTSNLTADATDWGTSYPGAAIFHDGRVYAFDQTGAEDVYYISTLLDHGDFSVANGGRAASIAKGQGRGIKAMISYQGTSLLVFKSPGIYVVDTTNVTGYWLGANEIRPDVGCAGPGAVVKVGTDVLFISEHGRLMSLQALGPERDPRDADITEYLNFSTYLDNNLDRSRLKWAKLIYNPDTKNLYYYFTSLSSSDTINDRAIVFNLDNPQEPRATIENRGQYFNGAWHYVDSSNKTQILVGGEGGKIYNTNSDNRGVGNTAYTSLIKTPETSLDFLDSRLQGVKKRFDYLELYIIPTGDIDITIDFFIDGSSVVSRTINLSADVSAYDTAVYDTDVYATNRPVRKAVPINAWGETISFSITVNGLNENLRLVRYKYMFKPLGEIYEA